MSTSFRDADLRILAVLENTMMLRRLAVLLFGVMVVAGCEAPPPAAPEPTEVLTGELARAWQGARLNIVESAELLEEAQYGFRPVDSVRTFGQLLTHIAGANYVFCAAARGEAPPHAEDAFEASVTARADVIRVLGESMTYCDEAYERATDQSLSETVEAPFTGDATPRMGVLVGNIGHLNEHYGNLVTYFRINDIVPPSSLR
jgi:uncharacterized damage-inducible protein DinB